MTITTFQSQLKPGMTVIKHPQMLQGTVLKISKDRDKALVQYENNTIKWSQYFVIEFETKTE